MNKFILPCIPALGILLGACNNGQHSTEHVTNKTALSKETTIRIINDSHSVISSAQIKNTKGNILFSKNNINCNQESSCLITLNDIEINNDQDVFFYDKDNKLISAYDFSSLLNQSASPIYIPVDEGSLGLYAYNLVQKIDPYATYEELELSFGEKGKQYSAFDMLGAYYRQEVNAGKTPSLILHTVAHSLIDGTTLGVNSEQLIKKNDLEPNNLPMLMSSPTRSTPFCHNGLKTAIGLFDAIAKGPFSGIAIITKSLTALQYSACYSGTNNNYSARFDQINASLTRLQGEIAHVRNGINRISAQLSNHSISVNLQNLHSLTAVPIDSEIIQYNNFLSSHLNSNRQPYTSITAYVTANGGIDRVRRTATWSQLSRIYTGTSNINNALNNFNHTQAALRTNLNEFCNAINPSIGFEESMSDSIFNRRILCNYYTLDTYINYSTRIIAAQNIVQDLLNSTGSPAVANSVGMLYINQEQIRSFTNSLNLVNNNFGSQTAFTNLTAGLEPEFITRLLNVGCSLTYRDEQTHRNVTMANITDWQGGTNPYLVTRCQGDRQNNLVTSHYHYKYPISSGMNQRSIMPRNVMGVLVPNEFFQTNNNTNQNLFQLSNSITHSTHTTNGHNGMNNNTTMWYRLIAPNTSRTYSSNSLTSPSTIGNTVVRINPQQFQSQSINGQWNIMTAINNNLLNVNVYENRVNPEHDFNWNDAGNIQLERSYYTFIRITEAGHNHLSRVWAIIPRYTRFRNTSNMSTFTEEFRQQCMTFECTAEQSNAALNFNGIMYGWVQSGPRVLDSSYTLSINGRTIPTAR